MQRCFSNSTVVSTLVSTQSLLGKYTSNMEFSLSLFFLSLWRDVIPTMETNGPWQKEETLACAVFTLPEAHVVLGDLLPLYGIPG